jgi:aspartate/methionine/tyrosine aminotransferase
MTFSSVVDNFDQPINDLYAARDSRLKSGRKILDLISGNVNTHGIRYPQASLKRALKSAVGNTSSYRPDPLGQALARKAISQFYKREGVSMPHSQLVLTPGTSISYWYCFKLLCNPEDEILCPAPSYPLFESIAALSTITLISYPLLETDRWRIDSHELERRITPRTKAIVLISPHNPTGSVATREEVQALGEMAAKHGLALIHDEVFSPFVFQQAALARPIGGQAPLVLTLNGFSKMFALPGMKIGWIGVTGDPKRVQQALHAFEMISDTFLPVNEWAQEAVPAIFTAGLPFLRDYQRSIAQRSQQAVRLLQGCEGLSTKTPEGGFFMTVRLDGPGLKEEEFATDLLKKEGVLVHPGYFYDMPGQHFVMTIVATPSEQRQGFLKIKRLISGVGS